MVIFIYTQYKSANYTIHKWEIERKFWEEKENTLFPVRTLIKIIFCSTRFVTNFFKEKRII